MSNVLENNFPLADIKVGIVIVNYNSENDVLRCLDSIYRLQYPNFFVILVDNNSPDGSGSRLKTAFQEEEKVFVTSSSGNLGFASGCNIGIKLAREKGADAVWLLNADTTVAPDALTSLVQEVLMADGFAETGFMVCGSRVYFGKDTKTVEANSQEIIWSAGANINLELQELSMRGWQQPDCSEFDVSSDCDYLPGCSIFFPVKLLDVIGFMPEEYFMYFEETDWCSRMKRVGVKIRYVPSSKVWHFFNLAKTEQPFMVYYYNRNSLLFWFRQGGVFQKLKLVLSVIFKKLPRVQYALFKAPNEELLKVFKAQRAAYLDFLSAKFGKRC